MKHPGEAPASDTDSQGPEMRREVNAGVLFGGNIQTRPEGVIRIGFQNINGFPNEAKDPKKYDTLRAESGENGFGFDIQSFVEVNRRWNVLPHNKQFRALTQGWWDRAWQTLTWLQNDDVTPHQYGGIATILNRYLTSTKFENGEDEMGRWTWVTLRGKEGVLSTIITAYRPQPSGGEASVEAQQLRYIREQGNIYDDPIKLFDDDLIALIEKKRENGHRMIVMGDFNIRLDEENIFTTRLTDLGFREVIIDKYMNEGDTAPPTYRYGRYKIDGIWATDDIDILQGGHGDMHSPGGDHCWNWADVTARSMLGGRIDAYDKPLSKKLNCKQVKIRETFQCILDAEYKRHNLAQKLETLQEEEMAYYKEHGDVNHSFLEKYDKLQRLSEECIQSADLHCKKRRTGKVAFSPKIRGYQAAIILWKEILAYKTKHQKNYRLICRHTKMWHFTEPWRHLTINEIQQRLRTAKRIYRQHKPRAWEERRTFLGAQANDLADRDLTKKGSEYYYRQLIRHEEEERSFHRIKYTFKPAREGVSRVEIENEDGTRTLISDKANIEREIGRANKEKLVQANNTPLRMEPLFSHFGETGDFDKWDKISSGQLSLPDGWEAEEGTRLWFKKIQKTQYESTSPDWNTEEYTDSWRAMDKRTALLPGPSFSHFKAPEKGSIASTVHSILDIIPLLTGIAPTRWCQAVASMIPKKKHDLRPSKLRLITLLHATFNHNNKWIGKEMMKYGEHHNQLAREQYGSRKKKSSGQHALNK